MRAVCYIITGIVGLLAPFLWFLVPLFVYLFFWTGFELLLIGIIVDSIFGTGKFPYLYTTTIGIFIIIATFARPYMSWYDTDISSL